MKKFISTLMMIVFLSTFCLASGEDLTWNGASSITLSKQSFDQNEAITGTISLNNFEYYPLVGGKLVLQVGEGTYSYPSQFSPGDNILSETIIPFEWILPRSKKEYSFSLPPLSAGSYRLDVYAWISKSKFIGASNIFYAPLTKNFTVTGTTDKKAVIVRDKTSFNSVTGPVGFPIEAEKSFDGEVFITNQDSKTKSDLKLVLSVCEWASVFCDENETVVNLLPLAAGESRAEKVSLKSPLIPSVYEIKIKLYSGDTLNSNYKSRVIVSGGTAKIRKFFIDGLENKDYSVGLVLTGSPDHFNDPVFYDFTVSVEAYLNEELIEEKSTTIASISTETIKETFELDSTSFNKICGKVSKDGMIYELQCLNVPLEDIQNAYDLKNPKVVQVDYVFDEPSSTLKIILKKELINARIRVSSTEKTIFTETVTSEREYSKTIQIEKENLSLTVDDLDAKRQVFISLNLKPPAVSIQEEEGTLPECRNTVCTIDQSCAGESYLSKQGNCCKGTCTSIVENQDTQLIFSLPLIAWIALILLVIAIIALVNASKKVKRK